MDNQKDVHFLENRLLRNLSQLIFMWLPTGNIISVFSHSLSFFSFLSFFLFFLFFFSSLSFPSFHTLLLFFLSLFLTYLFVSCLLLFTYTFTYLTSLGHSLCISIHNFWFLIRSIIDSFLSCFHFIDSDEHVSHLFFFFFILLSKN